MSAKLAETLNGPRKLVELDLVVHRGRTSVL
jgi:hypothetical protein